MRTYADLSRNAHASSLVLRALAFCKAGTALDLGAGSLRNTKALLERGFSVTAVDKDPITLEEAGKIASPGLSVELTTFEEFAFPKESYDLVLAVNALPFIGPESFDRIIGDFQASVKPCGIACFTYFGPKDTWAGKPRMTFRSFEDSKRQWAGWETLLAEEKEFDQPDIQGNPKHWHLLRFIMRKALWGEVKNMPYRL